MGLPLLVAGLSAVVFVWSLFQIETPVRGIVFDFDVIEHTQKGFVGIHKVMFNNSENIPVTCVHVLARGSNKADILSRVTVPAPFENDFTLDKFGFCKPFENSVFLALLRFACVIILFAFLVIEMAHNEHEATKKINVLPMRRSDPNIFSGPLNTESVDDAKEV